MCQGQGEKRHILNQMEIRKKSILVGVHHINTHLDDWVGEFSQRHGE